MAEANTTEQTTEEAAPVVEEDSTKGLHVEDDKETTETAEPEAKTEESDPAAQPDKQNVEKKIERQGYELAAIKKTLDDLSKQLAEARTPAQQQKVAEKVEDQLQAVADGDVVEGKHYNGVVRALKDLQAKVDQMAPMVSDTAGTAADYAFRSEFTRSNPDLSSRFDTLYADAQKRMEEHADVTDAGERRGIARMIWNQVVSEAKAAKKEAPAATKPNIVSKPVAKSSSSTPPPRVRPTGASNKEVPVSGSDEGIPRGMWVAEE